MMEKKTQQIYSRQGSNKALQQTDQVRKNNNDIQSTKPKNSARRRENKNSSTKFENTRQAGKKFSTEKRSKPRIFEHRNYVDTDSPSSSLSLIDAAAGSEGSIDFKVELNSIYTRGSKKQNLNHLLNFNYVTLEDSHNGYRRLSDRNTSNHKNCNKRRTKYNKEQYLQANFQFVINSSVDQSIVTCSPDTLIDWNLIEEIHIRTTEEPQCPICLFPPIAAKLTKCGHVYCWPCILHYLSLTDKSWRKCPICYEAVHLTDLKSTAIIQQRNFNVGDKITFQLMRRKKGSIVIEKALVETSDGMPQKSDVDDNRMFSKFLKLEFEEILNIIEREKHELLFEQDRNCPEFVFIHQALDLLEQRKYELHKSSISSKSHSTGDGEVSEKDNEKYYYFYQSNDAQNIFLHPLNIKMLQTMYSSLSNAPNIIEGRIVQKESQSMDEILRKKFTCLGHLPLTCQFEIVEIDIKPLVSKEVADIFEDEILLREKARLKRARDEKKREKHINEIYDRQMGKLIAQSANIDINSDLQFPVCGIDESSSSNSFPGSSPGDGAGASFSNVIATTTKKEFWPALDKPAQFKSFAELSCTVKPPANLGKPILEEPNSEDEDQCFPTLHSIGDVLSEALQVKQAIDGNSGLNKKSKKNAKPKVIFASGMNYKGN